MDIFKEGTYNIHFFYNQNDLDCVLESTMKYEGNGDFLKAN